MVRPPWARIRFREWSSRSSHKVTEPSGFVSHAMTQRGALHTTKISTFLRRAVSERGWLQVVVHVSLTNNNQVARGQPLLRLSLSVNEGSIAESKCRFAPIKSKTAFSTGLLFEALIYIYNVV